MFHLATAVLWRENRVVATHDVALATAAETQAEDSHPLRVLALPGPERWRHPAPEGRQAERLGGSRTRPMFLGSGRPRLERDEGLKWLSGEEGGLHQPWLEEKEADLEFEVSVPKTEQKKAQPKA